MTTLPLVAQPCPPEAPPQVDLGNLEMAFSETAPGEWTGSGIGGTVQVTGDGVDVLVNAVGGAASAVDLSLRFNGPESSTGHRAIRPISPLAGVVRQAEGRGFATGRSAYRELMVDGAINGAELTVSGSQRRLELALATTPAALEGLSFTVPGASQLAVNEDNGALRIALPGASDAGVDAAPGRTLELALIALTSGSGEDFDRLPAKFTLDGDGRVGVRVEEVSGTAALQLIFTVLYSPYVTPTEVVRTPSGTLLALTPVRAEAGSNRRRALAFELDAKGARVLSHNVLDPGGDFEPRGLAVDREGRILIAGNRDGGEGASLYVGSFDSAKGQLVESPATRGLDVTAHDINVTAAGEVNVVGLAGDGFAGFGRDAARFSVVSANLEGAVRQRIFVAALDASLERLSYAVDVEAEVATATLHVWEGCDEVVVGPGWKPGAQLMVEHTYSIEATSTEMGACPQIDDGWGYGAMCWKSTRVPDWTYHIGNVDPLAVPVLIVQPPASGPSSTFPGDYKRLNELEANQHGNLFFNVPDNIWDDPGGGWNHPDNWAYSSTEMAVAAAIYHERWGSPIFVNFRLADGNEPPAPLAVMVRSETFSADSASGFPHNACDEDLDGDGHSDFSGDPWPNPPEFQVAAACVGAHDDEFELETVDYDAWLGGAYMPDNTVSQSNAFTWWPWFSPYVGDPPPTGADDPMTPAHVREMSRRLMDSARVTVPLRQARYVGGVLQHAEQFTGRLCVQDLLVQTPAL